MIPIRLRGRSIRFDDPLFVQFINSVDRQTFAEPYGGLGIPDTERFVTSLRSAAEFVLAPDEEAPFPGAFINLVNLELKGARVEPRLILEDGKTRLVLEAPTLAEFMVFEMTAAVEAGIKRKICEHCNRLFLYGPQTHRQRHAVYCADRCRVAAMRARRSLENGDKA